MSANFIKYHSQILAPLLLNIFNAILETGIVPQNWKVSFLSPIPKKGSLATIEIYRGIAMQSVTPKIFDKILTAKLHHYVQKTIPECQPGFTKRRSTMSNLLDISQYLHYQFNKENRVDVVYFDFTKAFHQVDHQLLVIKLASLSMPYLLFKTVLSFITNRTYVLKVDGITHQNQIIATSSAPQRSHCGPSLYTIMSSDIIDCVKDTGVEKNKILLNRSKTYHVTYSKKKNNRFASYYYLGTTRIVNVPLIKDLGVLFDSQLTF